MKKSFLAVWETHTNWDTGRSTHEHTAIVEAEDNPKEILIALRNCGLCWELALGVSIYELGRGYDSRELLSLLGFKGETHEVDEFLKGLEEKKNESNAD